MKVYRIQNGRTGEWYRGAIYSQGPSTGRVYSRQRDATAAAKRAVRRWNVPAESVLIWEWELNERTFKSVRTLA